ncbi:MAG: extracellular solute-binding protein [Oscillospiraceae bacterium]|nr:extracellular solute-binding protein [Oscillospiraceae bacterium]
MDILKKAAALALSLLIVPGLFSYKLGTLDANAKTADNSEKQNSLAESLPKSKLKNKKVKWLSYYDAWDERGDPYHQEAAKLFEKKYGGKIDVRYTTWNTRFNDLATMILGGEGVDLFPGMERTVNYAKNTMFQGYDKYVDWESPIWSSVKKLNDPYVIGKNHYLMNCYLEEEYVVFYNKKTIKENGFVDPWKLYKNDKWTMSRFTAMLEKFVDEDNERYGLDGWNNAIPLSSVGGVPAVSLKKGKLVSNVNDPAFKRSMNYQYNLYQKGLVLDKSVFNYASQEQFISEGKELFYIAPTEAFEWFGDLDDIGIVPIPKDNKSDKYYHNARLDSYNLCRGAGNPKGAVRLIECLIASYSDKSIRAEQDDHYKTEYGWTDDMIKRRAEIRRLAQKNPVVDISGMLPTDPNSVLIYMINQPILEGTKWDDSVKECSEALDMFISEINAEIAAAG